MKTAVFANNEEVKHETQDFVPKEPKTIDLDDVTLPESMTPATASEDTPFYTGMVYSKLDLEEKSLESDKLHLANILEQIESTLAGKGMSLRKNGVYVNLQVRDMATFAQLNKLYVQSFGLRPPVRVCVQPIGSDIGRVCMGAYCLSDAKLQSRVNLHVQSFSRWAPANIGPYS